MFKYNEEISFGENTSHGKLLQYINHGDRILEFGCAKGVFSKYVKEHLGCTVYGIEINKDAYCEAKQYLDYGICCDIEAHEWESEIGDIKFDVIMFADVLEHLKDPVKALTNSLNFLKEDGKILFSIPNIAHCDIILKLLNNRFDYSDVGLLDNTHIHFWGGENLTDLCDSCGLFLSVLDGTTAPIHSTEQRIDSKEFENIDISAISSKLYGNIYQFICMAFKKEYAEKNKLSLCNKIQRCDSKTESVSLLKVYFDLGAGYSEENSDSINIHGTVFKTGRISVPLNCKKIRIDPIEGKFIYLNNLVICSSEGLLEIETTNAENIINGCYYFDTVDPQIIVDVNDKGILWIEVAFNSIIIDNVNDLKLFSTLNREISAIRNQNRELIDAISEETSVKDECFREICRLKENTAAEIEKLNSEHFDEIEKLNSEHSAEIENMNTEYSSIIEQIEGRRVFEIDSLKASNSKTFDELNHYKIHYDAAINQREELKKQVVEYDYALNAMRNAQFWKITAPARKVLGAIKNLLRKNRVTCLFCKGLISLKREGIRKTWYKVKCKLSSDYKVKQIANSYKITKDERELQEKTVFDRNIKFSILVPLYNTPISFLYEMIASVKAQTYTNWELCLADGSDKEHDNVKKEVLKLAKKDERIKYKKLENNLGISENTNACIDMSTGDYITLFDHDDILHPAALYEVMKAICERDADFVYTDEATFESPDINKIITAHFKPDFAVDNLRANNYICHLSTFSREVLEKAGKFRHEYDGSQDHDMILRLTKASKKIAHIPKILYYWRSHPMSVAQDINSKTYAIQAGKNAVHDSIETYGYDCIVESSRAFPTIYRINYEISSNDLVSIIIPNKNHYDDLKKCIDSILNLTTYPNYEIIIVDNGSDDKKVFEYYEKLKKDKRFVICSLDIKFNYSKLNNYAVTKASGKYYVLLNNDIEIITPEWIEELLMYVQREDVGAAGAMLYYPDDTIQHAGIILKLGAHRVAGHAFHKCSRNSIGYMGRLCYAQNMSAVTAACMMVKASVYKEVRGLDESFEVAYNDVDFCLKIRKKGYNIVWTPYCEAYHYESKSRGSDFTPEQQNRFQREVDRFKEKWMTELQNGDPYYNPNFSLDRSDFSYKG